MSAYIFFIFLCLSSINFLIRIAPRLRIKYYGDDTWSYLSLAEHVRKRDAISQFYDCIIMEESCCDPLFLSKILSYFPKRIVEEYQGFISPIFDTLNLMILLGSSFYLYNSIIITVFVGLFYIFYYPILVQCFSLNTRILGYLLFNIAMMSLLMSFYTSDKIFIIIFILSGALILNTSRMATQAFIFSILGLSIFYLRLYFILFLPGIFVTALILSKGQYLKVIKGHLMNVKFHFSSIFSPELGKYPSGSYFTALIKLLLWGTIIFISLPKMAGNMEKFLYIWGLTLLFIFLITTFVKPLKCIGEGYRYLDYSVVPVSIIFSRAIVIEQKFSAFMFFCIYILISIFQLIKHFKMLKNDYINIIDEDRFKVFNFLKKTSKERLFCLPNGMSHATIYFTRKKLLWVYFAWQRLPWLFPQINLPPRIPFKEIISNYKLDYILLHKRFALPEQLGLDNYKLAFTQGDYCLLEVS